MFIRKNSKIKDIIEVAKANDINPGAKLVYIYLANICKETEYTNFIEGHLSKDLNISTAGFYRYIVQLRENKYLKSDNLKKTYIEYTLY